MVLLASLSNELWRCATANFVEKEFLEVTNEKASLKKGLFRSSL
jgi:hypothetical protein